MLRRQPPPSATPPPSTPPPAAPVSPPPLPPELTPADLVIEARTGRVRQAGAAQAEGSTILELKRAAQRDLFIFAKFILQRRRLVPHFHGRLCRAIQQVPPRRKCYLIPMGTFKTSIISQSLPIHMHIQDAATNGYWSGLDGAEMRVLLACETEGIASSRLRWIEGQWEENKLLKAFWPHRMWDRLSDAPKWNETEMVLRRSVDFPEPSLRAIGVGGAFVGHHYNVIIKDDLIGFDAANSRAVMESAIDWHKAARTRFSPDEDLGLEFIIGTRWAPGDLYEVIEQDPTVEFTSYGLIQDGKPLIPEIFPLEKIEQLQREEGVMFWLWRMNSAANPELVDFDLSHLRTYKLKDNLIYFDEDDRDIDLAKSPSLPAIEPDHGPRPFTVALQEELFGRREDYFAGKYGRGAE